MKIDKDLLSHSFLEKKFAGVMKNFNKYASSRFNH